MRKLFLLLGLLAALAIPALPQTQTVVTGTVTDPNGIPYANGTMKATIQPVPPGSPCVVINGNCQPIQGTVGPISMNSSGFFSTNLWANSLIQPSGSQWSIQICISPGVAPPLGTGPQCFSVTITISGSSQDLSTVLDAAAPLLSNISPSGNGVNGTVRVINVQNSPYNAKGNSQSDLSHFGVDGSPDFPACPYAQATTGVCVVYVTGTVPYPPQIGQMIWLNEPSTGTAKMPQGTVTQIITDGIYTDLVTTASAGDLQQCAFTTCTAVWGNDDSAAIQSAVTAASSGTCIDPDGSNYGNSPCSTVYFPPGGYILCGQAFSLNFPTNANVAGGGLTQTTIFPCPIFPSAGISANSGLIVNWATYEGTFSDLSFYGSGGTQSVPSNNPLFEFGGVYTTVKNIGLSAAGSNAPGASAISALLAFVGQHMRITHIYDKDPSSGNTAALCGFNATADADVYSIFCSNGSPINLAINGISGGSSGDRLAFYGGLIDECSENVAHGACTQVTASKDVYFFGTTLFGGSNNQNSGLSVDGTSTVRLFGVNLGPFGSNGGSGIDIASGGTVYINQSEVRGNKTGSFTLNNAGTLYSDAATTWTTANSGTLFSGNPILTNSNPTIYTVSTLPSASSVPSGTQFLVSDSLTFTPGSCTGGGSDTMIAVSNGTAWSCH